MTRPPRLPLNRARVFEVLVQFVAPHAGLTPTDVTEKTVVPSKETIVLFLGRLLHVERAAVSEKDDAVSYHHGITVGGVLDQLGLTGGECLPRLGEVGD